MSEMQYTLGIDIGSTTVKIAILGQRNQIGRASGRERVWSRV